MADNFTLSPSLLEKINNYPPSFWEKMEQCGLKSGRHYDKYDHNPLHFLASHEFPLTLELIEFLIDDGFDVNTKTVYGDTPLHLSRCFKTSQLLIKKGADVLAQNIHREYPFHKLITLEERESKAIFDLLMEHTPISRHQEIYNLAFRNALFRSDEASARHILPKADVHHKETETTTLMLAAEFCPPLVGELLAQGIDDKAKNGQGYTAEDLSKQSMWKGAFEIYRQNLNDHLTKINLEKLSPGLSQKIKPKI